MSSSTDAGASQPSALPAVGSQPAKRVRVQHLRAAKQAGEKLTMLTTYDLPTARIFDAAGVDMLLVGDSYGDNMLGHQGTIPVTVDELLPAVRAVSRGAQRAMVVADLPFGSYEASPAQAMATAARMLKEGHAHAVKFEGGRHLGDHLRLLTASGVPVVGHLGFTPQSENILGGKRVQGRGEEAAQQLLDDARALEQAGAIALVLEMVPAAVASEVTAELSIPTIGIGAGAGCDGQVLVWLDMAGMGGWSPRFAKQFGSIGVELERATVQYIDEVRSGTFPAAEHTYWK
ncbi:MAG: 3-methyl-2-oxobutanoate hydroxymethyltransferase [Beutenbergiaceae bacterium]